MTPEEIVSLKILLIFSSVVSLLSMMMTASFYTPEETGSPFKRRLRLISVTLVVGFLAFMATATWVARGLSETSSKQKVTHHEQAK